MVFAAFFDPTRRGMLGQLANGEANITKLTKPFAISQPVISKHIRVLNRVGLIQKTKNGRENLVRVDIKAIKVAIKYGASISLLLWQKVTAP